MKKIKFFVIADGSQSSEYLPKSLFRRNSCIGPTNLVTIWPTQLDQVKWLDYMKLVGLSRPTVGT